MPLERFHQIRKRNEEESLIEVHHRLMKHYGYIPLESLKKMPIPTICELLDLIDEYERELERIFKRRK